MTSESKDSVSHETADALSVYSLPFRLPRNPYLRLLDNALRVAGVLVAEAQFDQAWLERIPRGSLLHIHWPGRLYLGATRDETIERIGTWQAYLDRSKQLGHRLVWTAHNVDPHEARFADLNRTARRALLDRADHLIVHCPAALAMLGKAYGDRLPTATIVPHPNYIDAYSPAWSTFDARAHLGIRSKRLLLFFGNMRPSKGLANLVRSLRSIRDPELGLLIAGHADKDFESAWLAEAAEDDPRIHVHLAAVADADVPMYFGAADLVVCPYEQVLTSGVVALAQSMGRAVLAPALGCVPDQVPAATGVVYDPSLSLEAAITSALTLDLRTLGKNAQHFIKDRTWHAAAVATKAVYQQLVRSVS